ADALEWVLFELFKHTMTADNIEITRTLSESLKKHFESNQYSSILVLTDSNTERHCYPLVAASLPEHTSFTIIPGEEHKNIQTCSLIWEEMTRLAMDRKSLLINLG